MQNDDLKTLDRDRFGSVISAAFTRAWVEEEEADSVGDRGREEAAKVVEKAWWDMRGEPA